MAPQCSLTAQIILGFGRQKREIKEQQTNIETKKRKKVNEDWE